MSSTIAKDAALLEMVDPTTTMDLHRSNLLRLQVTELLEECQIVDLGSRKWAMNAQEYIQTVIQLVQTVPKKSHPSKESTMILGDKPVSLQNWPTPHVEPIGCTKTNLAWAKPSGNAQVLPTFQLMVLIPSGVLGSKDYMQYRYFDVRA